VGVVTGRGSGWEGVGLRTRTCIGTGALGTADWTGGDEVVGSGLYGGRGGRKLWTGQEGNIGQSLDG
jgi:hypothetical protein